MPKKMSDKEALKHFTTYAARRPQGSIPMTPHRGCSAGTASRADRTPSRNLT